MILLGSISALLFIIFSSREDLTFEQIAENPGRLTSPGLAFKFGKGGRRISPFQESDPPIHLCNATPASASGTHPIRDHRIHPDTSGVSARLRYRLALRLRY